ncbi:hypothetical protein Pla110_41020 [Polystyrenella longa]|uniref:DUF1552 domain-containing protein n=1 Tax=Polystyrenella longa TaxID=2528007 RepID=A0A518CSZ0_9PLAN|nr:DUF1552 domain-containing protein [Polystyrenella longa]QDU82347.1 hypothetical protein Pla110_41020 [Polystyrenella longa]
MNKLNRRRFLKGLGVTVSLPWLESIASRSVRGEEPVEPPQRMLMISNNLGILSTPFFPENTGKDYQLSPYLNELADFRNDFSVISGLSHPDVAGGHSTENCFLTAARGPTRSGFRNSISLDQYAAEALGPVTRFSTLNLGVNIDKANRSLSWTRDGALLPAEDRASVLFHKMFVQEEAKAIKQHLQRLEERRSILDVLMDDTRKIEIRLGQEDRARLDQYLTSIREVEMRLESEREWELRPKPVTDQPEPQDIQDQKLFFEKFDLMLSMAQLALESDCTRIVTLMVDAFATPAFQLHEGQQTSDGYHNLSHHGQAEEKLAQLEDADRQQMGLLHKLLQNLASKPQGDQRLLDYTSVLYGSNMGDANTHDNTNLPILLAGGDYQHGQHLAFRHDENAPLCNLFVSMLQKLGIETDEFGSSTGTLSGV